MRFLLFIVLLLVVVVVVVGFLYTNRLPDDARGILPLARDVITPPPLRGPERELSGTLTIDGVLTETNRHRAADSGDALALNATLNIAAKNKLDDMFTKQYFEHVSPNGTGPSDVVDAAGYEYIRVGENLALGNFASDAELVLAWMDSPGHRANILSKRFTEIGIAVGKGQFEGKQTWLAVQTFAAPASTCPSPDAALKQSLEEKDGALKKQQEILNSLAEEIHNLIREGNEEIDRGNEIYQETGDEEQARPHWEKGEELHARAKETQALHEKELDEAHALATAIQEDSATYNKQVNAFNACVSL